MTHSPASEITEFEKTGHSGFFFIYYAKNFRLFWQSSKKIRFLTDFFVYMRKNPFFNTGMEDLVYEYTI